MDIFSYRDSAVSYFRNTIEQFDKRKGTRESNKGFIYSETFSFFISHSLDQMLHPQDQGTVYQTSHTGGTKSCHLTQINKKVACGVFAVTCTLSHRSDCRCVRSHTQLCPRCHFHTYTFRNHSFFFLINLSQFHMNHPKRYIKKTDS